MTAHQLAQINIGSMLAPLDDPIMAEFVANLERINALADHSPGFVWRFQTPEGNATSVRPYGDIRAIFPPDGDPSPLIVTPNASPNSTV